MDFPKLDLYPYDAIRDTIRSGDIMLCSGNYIFSKLIQKCTGSIWSHAAFVMRLDTIDRIMVLESIESRGVRTIPLSGYVKNFEGTGYGYNGRIALFRHENFTVDKLKQLGQFAVDHFGYPYDEEEIARITTRIVGSKVGYSQNELVRDKGYICSEYVYECFKALGIEISYDKRGFVSPGNIADDPFVHPLFELAVLS